MNKPVAAPVSARRWAVDVEHSTATFTVVKLGHTVTGTVPIREGSVSFGQDGGLELAKGVAELSLIDTGNMRRDLDLRKPRFLDLDNHPVAAFVASDAVATATGWRVAGHLTVRGSSATVYFDVTLDGSGDEVSLCGTAVFDRRDLGIKAPRLLIGRTITMTVRARLVPVA
ncbi:YceI family protein [Antrihabitans sp. NCIMB 15449]|uniref:YceI family protein n=1 Tax=Antrihabitans spumae TaxID=3373370 RepID=A0ABW7JRS8_9NOCA